MIRNSYVPHTLRYDVEQHGRLPISYCVQIGLSLATALGHLHQHGLVHRDIKPSNVIFVDGVPKLGDIGLVAEVGDTQSIVGTEGYIPPEGPGTPRADLYSLGKVLYEIGTGMDRRRFSELPEELHTWPDRVAVAELNEIVLKACARDPARRYSSAEALQADLAVLQRGQSVKRKRTIQRRLAIVTKLSLIGGLVVLMAVGGLLFRGAVNRSKRADSEDWLQLEMKGTKKWEAWNAYIMGLHYYQRETAEGTKRAIEYLKEAIRLDTNFARPYAAFAEICRWRDDLFPSDHEALRQGKEAASRAVVLDDSLAQGHKELGYFTADLDRDFARAEKEFQRSIKLSPNSSAGHGVYACCILLKLRRLQEAKQEARLALKLARTVPRLWCIAASISRAAGEQDEAVRQLRKALDVDRNYAWALEQLGEIHEEKGEFPEAIESFRKTAIAREVEPEQAAQRSRELSRAFANDKARGYWQKKLELADLRSSRGGVLYEVALIYLQLGETNSMFECLKRLEAQKSDSAFGINFDRRFDSVRSEPQFRALLQKLGLEK